MKHTSRTTYHISEKKEFNKYKKQMIAEGWIVDEDKSGIKDKNVTVFFKR